MKFTIDINLKDNNSSYGTWSQNRVEMLLSLVNPKYGTTIVLSEFAAAILNCVIEFDTESKILIINDEQYKYVINPDFKGIMIEYEDDNGFVKTINVDNSDCIIN